QLEIEAGDPTDPYPCIPAPAGFRAERRVAAGDGDRPPVRSRALLRVAGDVERGRGDEAPTDVSRELHAFDEAEASAGAGGENAVRLAVRLREIQSRRFEDLEGEAIQAASGCSDEPVVQEGESELGEGGGAFDGCVGRVRGPAGTVGVEGFGARDRRRVVGADGEVVI